MFFFSLQLLIPHIRFTIAINTKAREQLICECGIFDKVSFRTCERFLFTRMIKSNNARSHVSTSQVILFSILTKANATGGGGHVQLVQKAMKSLTFRSLCFPDAIKARGVDKKEELPTYFYRDDGYKVWEATMR